MNYLKYKDLGTVITTMNKLYNVSNLSGQVKLQILRIKDQLKTQEQKFLSEKEEIVKKYVEKDADGKFKTFLKKIDNMEIPYYDFGKNYEKFLEDISPLLEKNIDRAAQSISITLEEICNTPLTINDIEILKYYGYIREGGNIDARKKIIIN